METLPITDARGELAEVVNRVAYQRERIMLTRRGKPLVAVVPVEDLELLEHIEDRADLAAMRAAFDDPDNAQPLAWEQVKADLGL